MEEKKWGGARKGAGRKKTGWVKYYGFNASQDVYDILESIEGSRTEYINKCILFYNEKGPK